MVKQGASGLYGVWEGMGEGVRCVGGRIGMLAFEEWLQKRDVESYAQQYQSQKVEVKQPLKQQNGWLADDGLLDRWMTDDEVLNGD